MLSGEVDHTGSVCPVVEQRRHFCGVGIARRFADGFSVVASYMGHGTDVGDIPMFASRLAEGSIGVAGCDHHRFDDASWISVVFLLGFGCRRIPRLIVHRSRCPTAADSCIIPGIRGDGNREAVLREIEVLNG